MTTALPLLEPSIDENSSVKSYVWLPPSAFDVISPSFFSIAEQFSFVWTHHSLLSPSPRQRVSDLLPWGAVINNASKTLHIDIRGVSTFTSPR